MPQHCVIFSLERQFCVCEHDSKDKNLRQRQLNLHRGCEAVVMICGGSVAGRAVAGVGQLVQSSGSQTWTGEQLLLVWQWKPGRSTWATELKCCLSAGQLRRPGPATGGG